MVALVLSGCGECVGELAVAPYPRTQLPHGGDEGHVGVVEVCKFCFLVGADDESFVFSISSFMFCMLLSLCKYTDY